MCYKLFKGMIDYVEYLTSEVLRDDMKAVETFLRDEVVPAAEKVRLPKWNGWPSVSLPHDKELMSFQAVRIRAMAHGYLAAEEYMTQKRDRITKAKAVVSLQKAVARKQARAAAAAAGASTSFTPVHIVLLRGISNRINLAL
ncbi:hypothetical protein PLESTF_000627000 [Pleodorina starrii]|nr:hypothetical protein PLESTM_001729300 [Pleodorina starrii]GLC67947.1 hypothetical protein PLESTF_000627000 [Pleodorina starrii]